MLHATIRSLLARKLRLMLSALAVVVGVSFVTGTLILTDTLNQTFTTLFADINANTAVAVRAVNAVNNDQATSARRPLPSSLVTTVAAVPGVRAAVGSVAGQAQIINPKTGKAVGGQGVPAVGINWTGGTPVSTATIAAGRAPRGTAEIVIDKGTADSNGLRVGERVQVQSKSTPAVYTIVGLFQVAGQDSLGGAPVTAFDTPTAQRVLLAPGQFSSILVAARPGVSQADLQARVARAMPRGIEAITGKKLAAESAGAIQKAVGNYSLFLLIFAGISVFVGAFIIFNTFTMLVAQRVRELALLRALGAGRGQVARSVQVEALTVGFIGATVGLVLGGGLAVVLRAATVAVGIALPPGGLVFRPRTVILAYAVGMIITSVAAYVPARKAGSVPPVAALRETFVLPVRSLRTRGASGVLLLLLGVAVLVEGLVAVAGKPGAAVVGIGAGLIFLGVTTISPLLSGPITRVLGLPLLVLFGATGRIGRENAIRSPRRTASTASALMIGLAVVSAFAVLGASIKDSVRQTVSNSLGADYILTAGTFGMGFSPQVEAAVAGKPGVALATGLRGGGVKISGKNSGVLAGEPAALPSVLGLRQATGNLRGLGNGTILLDSATAAADKVTVGQRITVVFPETGPARLTVAGTYVHNQIAGKYVISLGEFSRHFSNQLDLVVLVKRTPGADPVATRSMIEKAVAAYRNVDVRDQSQFIAQQEKQVDRVLGSIYVLLALAVVIALFGIVNTLALSVIERTREIGLLRAIGMSRFQMIEMVELEGVIIAVFGAVLGAAVGSFFGWALTSALQDQGITSFAYPILTIVLVVVVGGILGLVAAVLPAVRAARMNVLQAIATA